jgi:hypothetical protein
MIRCQNVTISHESLQSLTSLQPVYNSSLLQPTEAAERAESLFVGMLLTLLYILDMAAPSLHSKLHSPRALPLGAKSATNQYPDTCGAVKDQQDNIWQRDCKLSIEYCDTFKYIRQEQPSVN